MERAHPIYEAYFLVDWARNSVDASIIYLAHGKYATLEKGKDPEKENHGADRCSALTLLLAKPGSHVVPVAVDGAVSADVGRSSVIRFGKPHQTPLATQIHVFLVRQKD